MDETEYITCPDDWTDYNAIPVDYIFVSRPPVVEGSMTDYVDYHHVWDAWYEEDGPNIVTAYYRYNQQVYSVITFTDN